MWKNVSESKLFLDQIFEIKADSPQSHTASRLVSVCSIKARWIRPGYKRKGSLFLSPFNSQPPHFPPAVHRTIQHAYTQTHTCHQCKHFSSKANIPVWTGIDKNHSLSLVFHVFNALPAFNGTASLSKIRWQTQQSWKLRCSCAIPSTDVQVEVLFKQFCGNCIVNTQSAELARPF